MTRKMKDSGVEWIGEIPENWETRRLKNGLRKKKVIIKKYDNQPILSLTMNGVSLRDLVNPKGKMPTTFDGYQEITPGNIIECLFDIDVTPRCVGIARDYGLTSPAYTQFEVINDFDTDFIYYYLLMLDNDKILVPISKSLRNTITSDEFLILPFSFPPLEEQRRISNRISTETARINSIISETQQSINELKKYKQALITETVTKGLDKNVEMKDSGIEWIGEIPAKWEVKRIGNYYSQVKSKNLELQETNLLSLSYGKIIRRSINVTEGLLPNNFTGYNIVQPEDIVLRMTDLQNDHVSLRTGLVQEKGIITSAYITIRKGIYSEIDSYYIHLFLYSFDVNKGFYGMGSGVRQGITFNDIKKIQVIVPPYDEQQNIINYLRGKSSAIDNMIIEKKDLVTQLNAYKQSLIYEYVTGKKEA
ncbi:restriction endonuclease subunit S [Enterococcus faecium]|uniref:restriction endonuclease subunit S n=1 Tax=Enterococcus faecium TaxID=1352 RepID=UPI0021CA3079|nr:restriction endonuclease subunit S [Enterococcus faecium]